MGLFSRKKDSRDQEMEFLGISGQAATLIVPRTRRSQGGSLTYNVRPLSCKT